MKDEREGSEQREGGRIREGGLVEGELVNYPWKPTELHSKLLHYDFN